jgi:hypothetical protein
MLGVIFLLVGGEKGGDEQCSPLDQKSATSLELRGSEPTVDDNITDQICPVFLILGFPIICAQLSGLVSSIA